MFDAETWSKVPFSFWTVTAFVFGSIVGSFLNVCIHRMPLGQSIVHPPSHCPHCQYSIPWYLNIPLVTWIWLGGKCAHCQAPISARYFLVELFTGAMAALCWISFGHTSPLLAAGYFVFIAGLTVGSFIDLEHLIIPDQITFGGMAAGLLLSLVVPQMHFSVPDFTRLAKPGPGITDSIAGLAIGAGLVYALLRVGKYFWGRQKVPLPQSTRVIFTEYGVKMPEEEIPFEELFYRKSDAIELQARQVELIDRCYVNVPVRLSVDRLSVGADSFNPEDVLCLEVVTDQIVFPREVMGPADVTFMGAIGAFLGWPAVFFALAASSFLGSAVGLTTILLKKKEWSSRIPYGPYLALGAVIWVFGGYHWMPFYWGNPMSGGR